ncbi:hypothetical protein CKA32_005591 [Geitlerinema sp. FC II]|nr:hypothetical protein CKA32_005591 [Geitlerinema sp. FC II]
MFQSLEGIFGFFNDALVDAGVLAGVSIPRRDFWVFQLGRPAPACGSISFQSLEGIFGFFNLMLAQVSDEPFGFNP